MSFVIPAAAAVSVPVHGSNDRFPVRRVYCVGRNYAEHAREMGFDPDREPPFFFCKPADAILNVAEGETGEFPYPPKSDNVHYEIELVAAIGKGGANISVESALEHVWGYAVGLDMTRRDRQLDMRKMGRPWELGKAFDHSAPIGPLYKANTLPNIEKAAISLDVNGEVRQNSNIEKLIWSIAETISYLSEYFHLQPGDLIFTGTPEGVGAVVEGDLMVGRIDGLPDLNVKVVAAE